MYKRIVFAVLIVSVMGCNPLKEKFGTGEETPELKAAHSECRSLADKDAPVKGEGMIKQMDRTRAVYDDCMKKKGYDRYGKKIK
jgi:hypothetical protein